MNSTSFGELVGGVMLLNYSAKYILMTKTIDY
ncbi:hypothetical protein Cyast_0380 [Cyanobacterium stanieri PCC 7202]|uniref:Uncharacterized protein n=1 Tax=Cyanobacterium stanieri (strain ATCC 29140 / PCC 7202) TaxID=292563 RepID=K9YIY2_CYASC|nr:hypothetical protein Cyast_0380 [Cyanobacterium stanieri PCC 7202]